MELLRTAHICLPNRHNHESRTLFPIAPECARERIVADTWKHCRRSCDGEKISDGSGRNERRDNPRSPLQRKPLRVTDLASERPISTRRKIMNPHSTHHVSSPDPELAQQERSHPITWLIFHAIAFYTTASYWMRFKRVCAWHQPRPRRMGGNPFAPHVTHGLCAECFARVSGEIISHGETDLRVDVTKVRRPGGPSLLAPPARYCAVPVRLQRPSAGDPDTTRPAILRGKPFQ
jgi:hypothetical protein